MRKSVVTVLAALAFTGVAATPAAADEAADPVETVSVTVNYTDLDVSTPEGAAKLDKRIDAAASEVCGTPETRSVKLMEAWEECKSTAKAGALEQLSILEPYENLALASVF